MKPAEGTNAGSLITEGGEPTYLSDVAPVLPQGRISPLVRLVDRAGQRPRHDHVCAGVVRIHHREIRYHHAVQWSAHEPYRHRRHDTTVGQTTAPEGAAVKVPERRRAPTPVPYAARRGPGRLPLLDVSARGLCRRGGVRVHRAPPGPGCRIAGKRSAPSTAWWAGRSVCV